MNLRELKEIFRMVEKTDFTEVEIVQGDWRVRVERGKPHAAPHSPTYVATPHYSPAPTLSHEPETATVEEPEKRKSAAPVASGVKETWVTSPFVGTFYRAPSPDTDPYIQVGQTIRKGQALCIIEAMKLMNEIESDFDGKVVEILAENGKPVEFGEKLIRIEPTS